MPFNISIRFCVQTYLFDVPGADTWPYKLAQLKTGQKFGQEVLRAIFCTSQVLCWSAMAFGHIAAQTATQPPLQEPNSRWCTGNFLVCLAMWQATAAQDIIGKIFGIFFPVAAFVSISFSHVVCLQAQMISLLS